MLRVFPVKEKPMKVLMLNGSRREKGCTYTALTQVAEGLKASGVESQIIHVGKCAIDGTLAQKVKEVGALAEECDGLVVGSPVYYAGPSGEICLFLDRLLSGYEDALRYKPGAVVASARRAGTTATLDRLAKYLSYAEMPVVTSCYWTMVHGNTPDQVMQDEEGVHVVRRLGRNMAWLLKSIEAGKQTGIEQPVKLDKPQTNFIG